MGAGGPPPPPLPPSGNAPPLPQAGGGGRDDLMAAIRGGGTGGLRKVKDTEKRDRSAAQVPGGETGSSAPDGAPPTPAGDAGGLAGALQAALAKRKTKVSGSGKLQALPISVFEVLMRLQMTRRMTTTIGEATLSSEKLCFLLSRSCYALLYYAFSKRWSGYFSVCMVGVDICKVYNLCKI